MMMFNIARLQRQERAKCAGAVLLDSKSDEALREGRKTDQELGQNSEKLYLLNATPQVLSVSNSKINEKQEAINSTNIV